MAMTSRERVLAVLNHEKPDRVPIVLGVSNATGIKMSPYWASVKPFTSLSTVAEAGKPTMAIPCRIAVV